MDLLCCAAAGTAPTASALRRKPDASAVNRLTAAVRFGGVLAEPPASCPRGPGTSGRRGAGTNFEDRPPHEIGAPRPRAHARPHEADVDVQAGVAHRGPRSGSRTRWDNCGSARTTPQQPRRAGGALCPRPRPALPPPPSPQPVSHAGLAVGAVERGDVRADDDASRGRSLGPGTQAKDFGQDVGSFLVIKRLRAGAARELSSRRPKNELNRELMNRELPAVLSSCQRPPCTPRPGPGR